MAGRIVSPTPSADLRRFHQAVRMAHGLPTYEADTHPAAVFREFGRWRWVVVPIAALALAACVFVIGWLAGAASTV